MAPKLPEKTLHSHPACIRNAVRFTPTHPHPHTIFNLENAHNNNKQQTTTRPNKTKSKQKTKDKQQQQTLKLWRRDHPFCLQTNKRTKQNKKHKTRHFKSENNGTDPRALWSIYIHIHTITSTSLAKISPHQRQKKKQKEEIGPQIEKEKRKKKKKGKPVFFNDSKVADCHFFSFFSFPKGSTIMDEKQPLMSGQAPQQQQNWGQPPPPQYYPQAPGQMPGQTTVTVSHTFFFLSLFTLSFVWYHVFFFLFFLCLAWDGKRALKKRSVHLYFAHLSMLASPCMYYVSTCFFPNWKKYERKKSMVLFSKTSLCAVCAFFLFFVASPLLWTRSHSLSSFRIGMHTN